MQPKPNPTAVCGDCGVEERRFLHHVRHRGIQRRLCTTCVLRLHPQSFCPTCFEVHHPPPRPPTTAPRDDAVLICARCYSTSHARCVPSSSSSSSFSSYVCPLCTHPRGTPLFELKPVQEADSGGVVRVMDADSAKKLLAAAEIASESMKLAKVSAWEEVEKRTREAVYARKKADEALEYLAFLMDKIRRRKRDAKTEIMGNAYPKVDDSVTSVDEVRDVRDNGDGGEAKVSAVVS